MAGIFQLYGSTPSLPHCTLTFLAYLTQSCDGRSEQGTAEDQTVTETRIHLEEAKTGSVSTALLWSTKFQNGSHAHTPHMRSRRGVMSKLKKMWKKKKGKGTNEWDLSTEEAAEVFETYYDCIEQTVSAATSVQNGIDLPVRAVMVLEGEKVTLGCLVCVRPDQDKQTQQAHWQHLRGSDSSLGPVDYNDRIFKNHQNSLVIKNADVGDAGQYTCLHRQDYVAVYQLDILVQERRKMVHLGERLQPESYLLSHNLRVLTVWAPWGPCDACDYEGKRQRPGTCTVMKIESDDPIRPRDFPMLDLYPDGVPCRSTALPGHLRRLKAVHRRLEETLVAECKVPCPTEPPPVTVTDKDGNVVEVVEPGKMFSLNEKPALPYITKRRVLYEPEGNHLVLMCGSESQRGAALRWVKGKRRIDPTSIRRQTYGRVWIDSANRLNIKDLYMSDTAVYDCWEREVHIIAIKVIVINAMNEKIKDYITIGGFVLTVIGSLMAVFYVCRRQRTAR